MLTTQHIRLVQDSWQRVTPIADKAAELFYNRLFQLNPQLQHLFKGDMAVQAGRLMGMIDTAVQGLTNLDVIVPVLQASGSRHKGYGVSDADYTTVGEALLWTLQQGLGQEFTPEVKHAWVEVYTILSNTMKNAPHQR